MAETYERLLDIEQKLREPRTRSEQLAFAESVVAVARTAEEPELQLLAAELVRRLARFLRETPAHRAPAHEAAAIAWLRAEIALDAAAITRAPFGERLLHALVDEPLADPIAPRAYLDALADREEEELERFAITETRRLLHAALLAPADAQAVLTGLAASVRDEVAASAVRELAEPWSLLLPPPLLPADRFARGEALAEAALLQAARRGLDAPLRGTIGDARLPPQRRRLAAGLYGTIAPRGDRLVIGAASEDPLLFGEPLVAFLRAQHRRGIFVAAEEAPALVDVFLANHAIDASALAAVAYSLRRELTSIAADAEPEDPTWPRRVELLLAIALGPRGAALGIDTMFRAVLARTTVRPTRRAILRAIEALRDEDAEDAVLALLDDEPEDALAALRTMGGLRAARAIEARLETTLAAFWESALEIAWQLGDAALRETLPRTVETQPRPALSALRVFGTELHQIFGRVCEVVDATELGVVLDLLLRVVSDIHPAAHLGPDEGRRIPDVVRSSLLQLGARLQREGAIRPSFLLDGPGFVSICCRVLLDRPDLTDDETFALVSELDPRTDARAHARLVELLRRREPLIRKVVIARLALGKNAEDLLVSLTRLTEEDDIQTVRQAILALASLGARGDAASSALASALDHRNMNVKKTAAEALRVAGGPGATPKLLAWLARHDNPGFRAALVAALRAILGSAYEATLLAARDALPEDEEDRARHRVLLFYGLDGCLDAVAARALVLRGEHFLVSALASGAFALKGGDLRALLVELDAAQPGRAAKVEPLVVPLRPEAALLRDEAPTIARVRAVLALELTSLELAALRPRWRDLVRLRDEAVLPLLVRMAEVAPLSAADLSLLADERALLLAAPLPDAIALLGLVLPALAPAARLEVARAVRAWPIVDGQRRFPLLRASCVLLVRADVERALAAGERDVLGSVFGTTGAPLAPADREALEAAVKGDRVADLRETWTGPPARTLRALVELYPRASRVSRTALLDWMEAIQPIGAPRNRLVEAAPVAPSRVPHLDDLDQPRSLPLRARLVAMLGAPDAQQRRTAAEQLLAWPEPEAQALVAEAWLRGDLAATLTADAASAFADRGLDAIRVWCTDEAKRTQLWRILAHARRASLAPLLPLLLDEYTRVPDEALASVIHRLGDEAIVAAIEPRLDAGSASWALVALLRASSKRMRARIAAIQTRARAEERVEIVAQLAGMLVTSEATVDVEQLRARRFGPRAPALARPSRDQLYATARTFDTEAVRRALTLLAEEPEPRLIELLDELVGSDNPRIRLHAHRLLRGCKAHDRYLAASARLLDDELPDVRRTAVRVVGFARYAPAAKKLVTLLEDDHPAVRSEAESALGRLGADARSTLERAIASARPDKRAPLERVLARL